MLKLALSGRHWTVTGQSSPNEVLFRTVRPRLRDTEILIHRAAVHWSITTDRRPESYEDFFESVSQQFGAEHRDTLYATNSRLSSGHNSSMTRRLAVLDFECEEFLPRPEVAALEPKQEQCVEQGV